MIAEGCTIPIKPTSKVAGVIEIFDDAIQNAPEVLNYIARNGIWQPALIGDTGPGFRDTSRRSNDIAWFEPLAWRTPDILRNFAKTVWVYLDDYATRYGFSFMGLESVNVNKYLPGDFYKPHADSGRDMPRIVSALVYLNDVEDGGETEFVHFGVSVAPKAGRLVIFPSNYAYTHAARPPVSGEKYSAAFWAVGT